MRWRITRFLFGLLYRSRTLYWLASTIPFAGQWRTWQRLVMPHLRGHDILELGCGTGTLLADMVQAGYRCTGIDRSPQMVAATRRELERRQLGASRATVLRARAQSLPFDARTFDTVISTFPTEYILDPVVIHEVARVLRAHGRVVILPGASLTPGKPLLAPLLLIQRIVYGKPPSETTQDAARALPEGLAGAFERAGFAVRQERVRGPFWIAFLIIADRS